MDTSKLFDYLKKWLPLILIACIAATFFVHRYLSKSQTYVASEVINYNDSKAKEGLTPKDTELDVNEIRSSAVLASVINNMNLSSSYSVDNLISRISITPVYDEEEVNKKAALLEIGEEYVYEPTTYIISFTARSYEGADFARQVLDNTLDVYFYNYGSQYINIATVNNNLDKLSDGNYDYIEMLELIDENISGSLEVLYQRMNAEPYFRSSQTGKSFNDIAGDLEYIQGVELSTLFAKVLKYQITKNEELLVSDYQTRIDENQVLYNNEDELLADVETIIDEYVQKMRDSGNTNITYEYILGDVYDKDLRDGQGNAITKSDQTVTYDKLIYGWRDHNEEKEHAIIDTAYCRYILDQFAPESPISGDEYSAMEAEISEGITDLVERMTELYNITTATNDEYNEYLGAKNISVLSSVSVSQTVNVNLYTMIAFVFFIIICCGIATLLGRLDAIVTYSFYTDRLTGLNSRAYLDKYLNSMDGKIIDDGTVIAVVDINNIREINDAFDRKTGDDIIKMFSSCLKTVFNKKKAKLIYNGNSQFIIVLEKTDFITAENILQMFRILLDEREKFTDVDIKYSMGLAETYKMNIHYIRRLLTEAMKNRQPYVSQAKR